MTLRKVDAASRVAALTLLLLAGFAGSASAQNTEAAPDGQTAPQAAQPEEEKDCVTDTGGFRQEGRNASYVIELQNNCERRLKCEVSAFITTAKGQRSGESILILAPKSAGAASRQTYTIPLRQASGMANVSHECNDL
jgi:hypothetical protein